MRIDLAQDRGLIPESIFESLLVEVNEETTPAAEPELSEDERIAATLARRHAQVAHHQTTDTDAIDESDEPEHPVSQSEPGKKSSRGTILFLVLVLIVAAWVFNRNGMLRQGWTWSRMQVERLLGEDAPVQPEPTEPRTVQPIVVLSDDQFNLLMPMPPEIRAMADSLAISGGQDLQAGPAENLAEAGNQSDEDTIQLSETVDLVDRLEPQTEPPPAPDLNLSDLDVDILGNHSLLLLLQKVCEEFSGSTDLKRVVLSRTTMEINGPRIPSHQKALDAIFTEFTMGTLDASGQDGIGGSFELVIPPVKVFAVDSRDALGILDLLANPFEQQLDRIILDVAAGVDQNPAKFEFHGTLLGLSDILGKWSRHTLNYLLQSATLQRGQAGYELTLELQLIQYPA